jgi:MFS family permease
VTPELDRADRAAAVRAAARSWRRAGLVDDVALAAVESAYPDDRARAGPVFRVLLFLFTVVAVSGLLGFLAAMGLGGHEPALATLAAAAGAALLALTELQVGALRRRQGGTEAATSLLGICLPLAAAAWLVLGPGHMEPAAGVAVLCTLAAALTGAAAWRWGYPFYAALGTAAALVALAHLPAGRAVWIALALAAAPALLRLSESPRLPPAHRSSAMAVLLVALAGLYLAVHAVSWEERIVERIGGRDPGLAPPASTQGSVLWWSAMAATALVPILVLAAGLRRRRLPLLLAGTVAGVASLATFQHYLGLGPAWLLLTGAGALWIAAVLGLWRYLDSGPAGERGGFTAAPLLTDARRQAALEVGVAVLTLQPEARHAEGERPFEGGGGRSGGAGATGEF